MVAKGHILRADSCILDGPSAVLWCMRFGGFWFFLLAAAGLFAEDKPAYTFGTTVVDSSGLQGRVFHLDPDTARLPDFRRMHPVGSVYTTSLNVWPQPFEEGFPSITERFEWFAIEYTGKFWVDTGGQYRFSLLSDDGAKLTIDDKVVVDLDGVHAAWAASSSANLTRGVHDIKVEYFQGPRFTVALVLSVARPGEAWRIFNMHDFKPPKDPEDWTKGSIADVRGQTIGNWTDLPRRKSKRR
jgi:hypothetical protein